MALTTSQQGAIRRALCEPPQAQNTINLCVNRAIGYDSSLESKLIGYITQFEENEIGTDTIVVDGVTIDPPKAKAAAQKAISESIGWTSGHSEVIVGRGYPSSYKPSQSTDDWSDYNG